MMRCAIVVPCLNGYELTTECLAAVASTTSWGDNSSDVFVVLVNNGSTDDTDNLITDLVVRNYQNRGFAIGCNQGVRALPEPVESVVLLNNDTVPHEGWLEPLLEPLERRLGPAVTGSQLLWPDGRLQHAGVHLYRDASGVLTAENIDTPQPSGRVDAVTGACMAVHSKTWEQLHGLDERYYNGYEDVDFCLRVIAGGQRIEYVAESVVTHVCSASGPERWAAVGENIRLLNERWNRPTQERSVAPRPRQQRGKKRR